MSSNNSKLEKAIENVIADMFKHGKLKINVEIKIDYRDIRQFRFKDFICADSHTMQLVVKSCNIQDIAIALKGAPEAIQEKFFGGMTVRAAKMLKEDMEALGPVRKKDVDHAQEEIEDVAKRLIATGRIVFRFGDDDESDDQLVY